MLKKLGGYLLLGTIVLLFASPIWARMTSVNYVIYGDVFSSGGRDDSSSTNYGLQDTIAEAFILSATSTSATYGIKAGFQELYPDQFLTFTIADSQIDFGFLSASSVTTDSNTMVISTNAVNGFTISVTGSTLTSGSYTIDAIGSTAAAGVADKEQFGINLVANTTPSIGAAPSGTSPIGSAANQYNTANRFAFNSGDTVATSTVAINETTFSVSYISNISSNTEAGTYITTLTYLATANF